MRLYLSAESKNRVAYYPDGLEIETKNDAYYYDINGDTDTGEGGLCTRTKGDIFKEKNGDWNSLTNKEKRFLRKLLENPENKVFIPIYPFNIEDKKSINEDELSEGEGTLCIEIDGNYTEIDFKFMPVFYGL